MTPPYCEAAARHDRKMRKKWANVNTKKKKASASRPTQSEAMLNARARVLEQCIDAKMPPDWTCQYMDIAANIQEQIDWWESNDDA